MITECSTAQGFDMKKLAEKLGRDTKSWDEISRYGHWNNYEHVLAEVGEMNTHGCYNDLMSIVADEFIRLPSYGVRGFSGWSHSLCHTFEKYEKMQEGREVRRSLLNSRHNQPYATKLVDEAIRRALEVHAIGCLNRILGPIEALNIDNTDLDQADGGAFYFRPESLTNPELQALFSRDKYSSESPILLLTATTPRDLLVDIVKKRIQHPAGKDYYGPDFTYANFPIEKLIVTLEKLQPELSQAEIERYLALRIDSNSKTGIPLDELKENIATAEKANEFIPGIFVDIEGTLLDKQGELNDRHIKSLQDAHNAGNKIIIITGGDIGSATIRLRELGVPEAYLPVQSKAGYRGKLLEILVDDTDPKTQGLKALHEINSLYYLASSIEERKATLIAEETSRKVKANLPAEPAVTAAPQTEAATPATATKKYEASMNGLMEFFLDGEKPSRTPDAAPAEATKKTEAPVIPTETLPVAETKTAEKAETVKTGLRILGTKADGPLAKVTDMVLREMAPELIKNTVMLFYASEDNQYAATHEAMEIMKKERTAKLIICHLGDKLKPNASEPHLKKLLEEERLTFADIISPEGNFWTVVVEFLKKGLPLEVLRKELSILQHDLKDYIIKANDHRLRQILEKARELFDIKPEASDKSVIDFIQNARFSHIEVMSGDISGVYCDLDDTLLMADGSLNQNTLTMIEKYRTAGMEVVIWTGGDITEAAKRIKGTPLEKFRLVSKADYCGATAEIVIDNVSKDKFFCQYGIKAKSYVRV